MHGLCETSTPVREDGAEREHAPGDNNLCFHMDV